MLPAPDARTSGISAILAAVVIALVVIVGQFVDWAFYGFIAVLALLLIALPGLRARQAGSRPRLSRVAFTLAELGTALLLLLFIAVAIYEATGGDPDDVGWLGPILLVFFLIFLVGMILVGVSIAIGKVLPRLPGLLLLLALPLGLLIDIATGAFFEDEGGETPEIGFYVGMGGLVIALAWLGYALISADRRSHSLDEPRI